MIIFCILFEVYSVRLINGEVKCELLLKLKQFLTRAKEQELL